eukprot:1159821-Pelagomonas_calceolata.AAC.3
MESERRGPESKNKEAYFRPREQAWPMRAWPKRAGLAQESRPGAPQRSQEGGMSSSQVACSIVRVWA